MTGAVFYILGTIPIFSKGHICSTHTSLIKSTFEFDTEFEQTHQLSHSSIFQPPKISPKSSFSQPNHPQTLINPAFHRTHIKITFLIEEIYKTTPL